MNILLLGNGFDIQHKLPTKYVNFLHTVNFLIKHYTSEMTTVGMIFSAEELQKADTYIAECYKHHQQIYNNLPLKPELVQKLIACTQNNIWFKYLLKSFDEDIGWIDFEKEISTVIHTFQEILKNIGINIVDSDFQGSELNKYLLDNFDFFVGTVEPRQVRKNGETTISSFGVTEDYRIEYPKGSGLEQVNTEKIAKTFSLELFELAKALRLYLLCFCEEVPAVMKQSKSYKPCKAYLYTDVVITLNYTNTFESLYSMDEVHHVHGNVRSKIVLGINSDIYDEQENMNTLFLAFKKYYQRTILETDTGYLRWLTDMYEYHNSDVDLVVAGHSLDITDKEIIDALFELANEITILYHSESAKASYVENLIKLYGKSGFDKLREERKLMFLLLDSDMSGLMEKRAGNSFARYMERASEYDPITII